MLVWVQIKMERLNRFGICLGNYRNLLRLIVRLCLVLAIIKNTMIMLRIMLDTIYLKYILLRLIYGFLLITLKSM